MIEVAAKDLAVLRWVERQGAVRHFDEWVQWLLEGGPFRGGIRLDPDDHEVLLTVSYARAKGIVIDLDAIVAAARADDERPTRERVPRIRLSEEIRRAVFERDDYRCVTCGDRYALAVDHIYPHSMGGPDNLDNFQTLCRSCNSKKGARTA